MGLGFGIQFIGLGYRFNDNNFGLLNFQILILKNHTRTNVVTFEIPRAGFVIFSKL